MHLKLLVILVFFTSMLFASSKDGMSTQCLKLFKKYDRSGDNFLQRAEFDKVISSKELKNLKKGKQNRKSDEPAFSDIDTNSDKKLSEQEFQVYLRYR